MPAPSATDRATFDAPEQPTPDRAARADGRTGTDPAAQLAALDAMPLRLAGPEELPGLILARSTATRAELADPGLTEGLEDRLEGITPFALLPFHAALRLFWSALPAGFAEAPRARGGASADSRTGAREAYLVALAGMAQLSDASPAQGRLALEAAVLGILDAAADGAQRRFAARTALARLRYAGAGTPGERALAEAALHRTVPGLEPSSAEAADFVTTRTAGLVLFAPYLRTLFDRAGVLSTDGRIADGRLGDAAGPLRALSRLESEGLDPLERILLGLAPGQTATPSAPGLAMLALTEGLTQAVIDRWGALGRTSTEGLRDAFVRREGELSFDPDGTPRLRVLPGAFDVLIDRLPWSIATVRAPWMPAALHVRWRNGDD
jgi:hypothetical protein